jgi:DNA-binding CsgD family transcriptional regulator
MPGWVAGDLEGATRQLESALSLAQLMRVEQAELDILNTLCGISIASGDVAWMAAECGQHVRAATVLGSAQRVRDESSLTLLELFREQHERSVSLVTRGIGQRSFDAAFARGRAMTIDEGIAFAVEGKQRPKPAAVVKAMPAAELTRRQLEIARLVADDLTNRQIAARLFLSERTVETHVTNILNRLGLNSRVELARWLAGQAEPAPRV